MLLFVVLVRNRRPWKAEAILLLVWWKRHKLVRVTKRFRGCLYWDGVPCLMTSKPRNFLFTFPWQAENRKMASICRKPTIIYIACLSNWLASECFRCIFEIVEEFYIFKMTSSLFLRFQIGNTSLQVEVFDFNADFRVSILFAMVDRMESGQWPTNRTVYL